MTLRSVHCIRLAAILAVVLVASPRAGAAGLEELVGQADLMHHQGILQEHGELGFYQVLAQDTVQAPAVELEAASGHGWHFEHDAVLAGLTEVSLPPSTTEVGSSAEPLRDLHIRTTGSSPDFDLRILALEKGSASFRAWLRGGTDLSSLPSAQITQYGGIGEHQEGVHDSPTDEHQPGFLHKVVDRPVVFTQAQGGILDFQVEGDFILEFSGVDVVMETGDGDTRSFSTSRDAADNGVDVGAKQWSLFRVIARDATLDLHHTDLDRLVRWVSLDAAVQGDDGAVRFEGLQDPQGVAPDHWAMRFDNGYEGLLAPRGGRLAVELTESRGEAVAPSSAWTSPPGFDPLPVVAVLVAVALATVVVRTARRTPELALMEDALEAGSFGRATRVASRILRTDPTRESARLGRAIALSRRGRPERVVRDLGRYLSQNEPADGTLHYVLGLAYRDLGRESAANEALSEAIRRTPSLAQQVPDVPVPVRRGPVEGDAQGYT